MSINPATDALAIPAEFTECFKKQKSAYEANRNPSYEQRKADLQTMHRFLVENREELIAAVNKDYGVRARFETILAELLAQQLTAAWRLVTGSPVVPDVAPSVATHEGAGSAALATR